MSFRSRPSIRVSTTKASSDGLGAMQKWLQDNFAAKPHLGNAGENIEAITGSAGSHADEGSGLANRGAVIGIVVAIAVVFIAAAIIVIWAARRSKSVRG